MTYIFKEFSDIVKAGPERPALSFKRDKQAQTISYRELFDRAVALGRLLGSKGIKENDRVAIAIGSQPEWPVVFMAIQYAGAVAVPLDINLPFQEIHKLLAHSGARAMFCLKRLHASLSVHLNDIKGLQILLVDSPELQEALKPLLPSGPVEKEAVLPPEACAALFYTSGSTDAPKAVMLSQKNLISNTESIKQLNITSGEDVFLSLLPLHHTYSFMVTCLLPLLEGARISYPNSLASQELLDCMRESKVNVLAGVPQLFIFIHRDISARFKKIPLIARLFITPLMEICWLIRRVSGLNPGRMLFSKAHKAFGDDFEYMISGGAPLDAGVVRDFHKWGFTLLEGYGLTETSPIAALNTPRDYRIGSVGKPIPGVKIKIVDPDMNGEGEVAIQGPNVMLGYAGMPREKTPIRDGWLFTGDLGRIDRQGFLYIKGRKDEMIVLGSGKKINPEEVEKIYGSSPFIKEICVYAKKGAGTPDNGPQLMAVIVPDENKLYHSGQVNIGEKIKWELDTLSYRLGSYKRVKGFVISKEALPRTTLGKIKRHEVEKRYSEGRIYAGKEGKEEEKLSDEDQAFLASTACQKALELMSKRLKRKVRLNDHLELDLGLDSLGRVEFLLELQNALKIEIPESGVMDLYYASTIKDLIIKTKPYLPDDAAESKEGEFLWSDAFKKQLPRDVNTMINLRPTIFDKILTFLVIAFIKFIFEVFFLFSIKGRNNFPEKGPCIICANHTSYLDPLVVAASIPFRLATSTYYVGFREIISLPLLKGMTRTARLVPIDMTFDLVEALQTCSYLLKNSKIICYFPEGQRSPDGEVVKFKKGIGILSSELNIPVVPLYIDGAFNVLSRRWQIFRLTRIRATVGKSIIASDIAPQEASKDALYESVAEYMRQAVISLKNKNTDKHR